MGTQEKRPRGDAFATALAAGKFVVHEHAQSWSPAMEFQVDAIQSSVAEGAHGAISAWVAGDCNRALGRELSLGEEQMNAELDWGGRLRELAAREKFDVFAQRNACHVS